MSVAWGYSGSCDPKTGKREKFQLIFRNFKLANGGDRAVIKTKDISAREQLWLSIATTAEKLKAPDP